MGPPQIGAPTIKSSLAKLRSSSAGNAAASVLVRLSFFATVVASASSRLEAPSAIGLSFWRPRGSSQGFPRTSSGGRCPN